MFKTLQFIFLNSFLNIEEKFSVNRKKKVFGLTKMYNNRASRVDSKLLLRILNDNIKVNFI